VALYRILQISDIHTGPPFRPDTADALVAAAQAIRPDLLVIAGDFVQRADFKAQWQAADELRRRLPGPQLTVPGNHDVPLYHLHLRLLNPLGRHRRYVSRDLNQTFERDGLFVVGANTAHGLTVDGGRLAGSQRRALREKLNAAPTDAYRIVVWHHPLITPAESRRRRRELSGARGAARLLDELQVDMLLCGHLHFGWVGDTRGMDRRIRNGTYLVQSGTATSSRGHGPEHGANSFNLITVDGREAIVQQWRSAQTGDAYVVVAEHELTPRRG
jgi:3',5'-cyclic AMP phosphodiesterase CpdA